MPTPEEMLRPLIDRTYEFVFNPPPGAFTYLPPNREVQQLRVEVGLPSARQSDAENAYRLLTPAMQQAFGTGSLLACLSPLDRLRRILRVEKIKTLIWKSRPFLYLYGKFHRQRDGQASRERRAVSAIGWGQATLRRTVQEPDAGVPTGASGEHLVRVVYNGSAHRYENEYSGLAGQVLVDHTSGGAGGGSAQVGTAGVQVRGTGGSGGAGIPVRAPGE